MAVLRQPRHWIHRVAPLTRVHLLLNVGGVIWAISSSSSVQSTSVMVERSSMRTHKQVLCGNPTLTVYGGAKFAVQVSHRLWRDLADSASLAGRYTQVLLRLQ